MIRRFLKWGFSSLVGHLGLMFVVWTLPFFVFGVTTNYSEGTLTWEWLPYIAFYCALSGVIMGILFWYTATQPLMRRRKRDSKVVKE